MYKCMYTLPCNVQHSSHVPVYVHQTIFQLFSCFYTFNSLKNLSLFIAQQRQSHLAHIFYPTWPTYALSSLALESRQPQKTRLIQIRVSLLTVICMCYKPDTWPCVSLLVQETSLHSINRSGCLWHISRHIVKCTNRCSFTKHLTILHLKVTL